MLFYGEGQVTLPPRVEELEPAKLSEVDSALSSLTLRVPNVLPCSMELNLAALLKSGKSRECSVCGEKATANIWLYSCSVCARPVHDRCGVRKNPLVIRHLACEQARKARVSRVQEGKEESESDDESEGDTDGEFNAEAPKVDGVTTVPPSSSSDAGEYEGGGLCPSFVATALEEAQFTPKDLYYGYGWVCRFRAAVLPAPLASAVCKASCVVPEAVLLTPCFVGLGGGTVGRCIAKALSGNSTTRSRFSTRASSVRTDLGFWRNLCELGASRPRSAYDGLRCVGPFAAAIMRELDFRGCANWGLNVLGRCTAKMHNVFKEFLTFAEKWVESRYGQETTTRKYQLDNFDDVEALALTGWGKHTLVRPCTFELPVKCACACLARAYKWLHQHSLDIENERRCVLPKSRRKQLLSLLKLRTCKASSRNAMGPAEPR